MLQCLKLPHVLQKEKEWNYKARGCADGRAQRKCFLKEELIYPTVSTQNLFISCAMDAIKGCKVVTFEILGAFFQANQPEGKGCYLKFQGYIVKMICSIDLSYKEDILTNKTTGNK